MLHAIVAYGHTMVSVLLLTAACRTIQAEVSFLSELVRIHLEAPVPSRVSQVPRAIHQPSALLMAHGSTVAHAPFKLWIVVLLLTQGVSLLLYQDLVQPCMETLVF